MYIFRRFTLSGCATTASAPRMSLSSSSNHKHFHDYQYWYNILILKSDNKIQLTIQVTAYVRTQGSVQLTLSSTNCFKENKHRTDCVVSVQGTQFLGTWADTSPHNTEQQTLGLLHFHIDTVMNTLLKELQQRSSKILKHNVEASISRRFH